MMRHRSHRWSVLATLGILLAAAPMVQAVGPGVHGRVLALDDKGKIDGIVAGAAIEFSNQAGKAVASTTSNDQGYYKIDLPPGTYRYQVKAAGYRDENVGRGITLKLNDGYAVYNFSLVKGRNDPKQKPPIIIPVDVGTLRGLVLERTPDGLVGIPGAKIGL